MPNGRFPTTSSTSAVFIPKDLFQAVWISSQSITSSIAAASSWIAILTSCCIVLIVISLASYHLIPVLEQRRRKSTSLPKNLVAEHFCCLISVRAGCIALRGMTFAWMELVHVALLHLFICFFEISTTKIAGASGLSVASSSRDSANI